MRGINFVKLVLTRYYLCMSELLINLIERIGSLLRARQRQLAAEYNLQPVHLQAIDYLSRCNRFSDTPAALAHYLGITRGTVSQSLRLLESYGFLDKQADKQDGRVVHLKFTAKGRQVVKKLRQVTQEAARLAKASTTENTQAVNVLSGLLRQLQAANAFYTFGECKTCRHLIRREENSFHCGLTDEPLRAAETELICREHEYPEKPAA